jgi:hypothetical protein
MAQSTDSRANEQRSHFLTGWLIFVIIYNLFTIVSFLTGGANPLAYITPQDNMLLNTPAIVIVNIASAAVIIFCVLIYLGYRLGYYGLVLSLIVMTIASLMVGFNIITVLVSGLVAMITWVLLRPVWEQMK